MYKYTQRAANNGDGKIEKILIVKSEIKIPSTALYTHYYMYSIKCRWNSFCDM